MLFSELEQNGFGWLVGDPARQSATTLGRHEVIVSSLHQRGKDSWWKQDVFLGASNPHVKNLIYIGSTSPTESWLIDISYVSLSTVSPQHPCASPATELSLRQSERCLRGIIARDHSSAKVRRRTVVPDCAGQDDRRLS